MAHDAHVAHHVPGRLRLRLAREKRDTESLGRIAEALGMMPGLERIEVNAKTGSILLWYDPDRHEDFHSALVQHGRDTGSLDVRPPELTEVDEIDREIEQEAEFLAEHSRTALAVVDFFKSVNTGVRKATKNTIDLKVALPAGMAVWAYANRHRHVNTPLWVSLAIFSFNSFVALHRPTHRSIQG